MSFNFDDLPRDAQKAFFAKLNAARAAREERDGGARVGPKELSRAQEKYEEEKRRREGVDRYVKERLSQATGGTEFLYEALRNAFGTPEDEHKRGEMVRLAHGWFDKMSDVAEMGKAGLKDLVDYLRSHGRFRLDPPPNENDLGGSVMFELSVHSDEVAKAVFKAHKAYELLRKHIKDSSEIYSWRTYSTFRGNRIPEPASGVTCQGCTGDLRPSL
ncbi:MAG: hypothetical protein ACOYXY_04215 [Thermodesulfobacteriota bacterium]